MKWPWWDEAARPADGDVFSVDQQQAADQFDFLKCYFCHSHSQFDIYSLNEKRITGYRLTGKQFCWTAQQQHSASNPLDCSADTTQLGKWVMFSIPIDYKESKKAAANSCCLWRRQWTNSQVQLWRWTKTLRVFERNPASLWAAFKVTYSLLLLVYLT